MGVKTDGIHPSALRAVLEAQTKSADGRQRIAQDAASKPSALIERFPGLLAGSN
jgi:hypothetical protein